MRRAIVLAIILAATSGTAIADDTDAVDATAGVDASVTRWGTVHQKVWMGSFDLIGSMPIGTRGVRVVGRMPLTSSFLEKGACCGFGIGNATLGVSAPIYRRGRLSLAGALSVSAPTAGAIRDDADLNPRYAAMAGITRDAGLYLPDTTTVRADAAGHFQLSRRTWLAASAGAHLWLPDDGLVVPLTVGAGWRMTQRLASDVAFTTIAKPDAENEVFLHAIELGVAWRGRHDAIRARLHVPLDDSLRDLDMLGAGVSYARSF